MTSRAIAAEPLMRFLLILALVTMSSCQVPQTNRTVIETADEAADTGHAGASLLEEGRSPSFSLKERFTWAIEAISEKPHSRQKRIAFFTVKFPFNTQLQIKWSIAVPIPAESKYKSKLSLAIPIVVGLPKYLVDDAYTPAFNTLFGNLREGLDTVLKEEEEESNNVDRRKRDLHVKERMELYDNFRMMMDGYGLPGQECLQRTVCEVAEAPFQYGVIGDFINVIFTPSVAAVSAPAADLQELDALLAAEEVGRLSDGQSCGLVYAGCPTSVFDNLPLMRHKLFTF